MTSFIQFLTNPETGFRLHRPLAGWTFAIILGTAIGYHLGMGMVWLSLATVFLFLAWAPLAWRSLWLCLGCFALTAWYAGCTYERNVETYTRLMDAQRNETSLILRGTIGPDMQIIKTKRGVQSARFTLSDATFADGTPVSGVTLRGRYYDADGPLPKMGEVLECNAKLQKNTWYNRFSFVTYGAPNVDRTPHRVAVPESTGTVSFDEWLEAPPESIIVTFATREIIQRKRAAPYARYRLSGVWLTDGRQLVCPKQTLYYYDASGAFPNAGETWHLWVTMRKNASVNHLQLTTKVEFPSSSYAIHHAANDRCSTLCYRLYAIRDRLAKNLALGVSDHVALPIQTMTLGATRKLPREDLQRYADAGIIHIFSISGLHVGIIAGLIVWTFAWTGVRLRFRAFLILPALLGYLLLTGAPPSAARACCMASIYFFAPIFLRCADVTSAFFVTAALSLLIQPAWIADVGALLSFVVMGGILLYMRPIAYFLNMLMRSRQRKTSFGEIPFAITWHYRLRRYLALLFALSVSAWIASLPLLLYFFGRLSIVGLLLNLAIPTLCIPMVWCACVSAFVGFIFPPLSVLLNRFNAFLLSVIDFLSDHVLTCPYAVIEIKTPITLAMLLFLLLLFLVFGLYLRALEKYFRQKEM